MDHEYRKPKAAKADANKTRRTRSDAEDDFDDGPGWMIVFWLTMFLFIVYGMYRLVTLNE